FERSRGHLIPDRSGIRHFRRNFRTVAVLLDKPRAEGSGIRSEARSSSRVTGNTGQNRCLRRESKAGAMICRPKIATQAEIPVVPSREAREALAGTVDFARCRRRCQPDGGLQRPRTWLRHYAVEGSVLPQLIVVQN